MPKHPLTLNEVKLYKYDVGIEKIDWDAMEQSSTLSEYIHDVRMAECLTDKLVPLKVFHSIAVRNSNVQQMVQAKISKEKGNIPYVNIQPWLTL